MGLTLLLTISTCLTMGTGQLVEGKEIEAAKEKSNEILKIAADEFDPTKCDILSDRTNEEQEEITKAIILNTFINFDFCSNEIKESLYTFYCLEEQDSSISYNEITTKATDNTIFNHKILNNSMAVDFFNVLIETTGTISLGEINSIFIKEKEITSENTNLESQDKKDSEISNTEEDTIELIPIIEEHDNSKLSININKKIDSKLFIGLDFPMDTCVSFYNIVSNWLNKKAMMSTLGTSVLWKYIVSLLATNASTSSIMSSIISLLSSVWSEFMSFFTSTGALGIIVAVILTIAAISTIYVICNIYVAGLNHKGWRIGTLIHSIFNWEWINETY